jgi:dihydroneopterin aldolase
MDIIEIKGIKLKAILGIKAWEKQLAQDLVLDIKFNVNAIDIATTDDITKTVDYQALTEFMIQFVQETKVGLIETLAEKLSNAVLSNFTIDWLQLSIHKPNALLQANDVNLTIERKKQI